MADHTINIDVIDLTVPELNHINIAIINLPNPVIGYSANAEEVRDLIQIPQYTVYEAGTLNVINGRNYYDYFPEENPGGGGGGGGGTPYTETELLDSPLVGNISSIILNDDMNNYDQLVFTFGVTAENQDWTFTKTVLVSNFGDSKNFYIDGMIYSDHYWSVHYAIRKYDDTTFTVENQGQHQWGEQRTIFSIKGIKFGSGSGGGSSATVDTAMSDSSTNAVQNKVIKGYVDGITGDINTVLEGVL